MLLNLSSSRLAGIGRDLDVLGLLRAVILDLDHLTANRLVLSGSQQPSATRPRRGCGMLSITRWSYRFAEGRCRRAYSWVPCR